MNLYKSQFGIVIDFLDNIFKTCFLNDSLFQIFNTCKLEDMLD